MLSSLSPALTSVTAIARLAAVALLTLLFVPLLAAPIGVLSLAADALAVLRPHPLSDAEVAGRLDAAIRVSADQGRFNGAVLAARDGRVVVGQGYGTADAENRIPNTAQTPILIGSLTKQFVAAGVLRLHAQRRLDVREPVCHHIPQCPPHWRTITIHQLLNHTSGIPTYTASARFRGALRYRVEVDTILDWMRTQPLASPPGVRFFYNNSGYVVLGHLIEVVTGLPFEDFLRNELFLPLGMTNTGYARDAVFPPDGARGHAGANRPDAPHLPYAHLSGLHGAGGMHSTVEDLYRWDQALYGDRVLPPALRQAMFSPGLGGYGYGSWFTQKNGQPLITHGGAMDGFRSDMQRYPERRVTIIMLTNEDYRGWEVSPARRLMETAARLLLRG